MFKKKEIIFWKRQWEMRKNFSPFFRWFPLAYPFLALILALAHYAFAFMTLLHILWSKLARIRFSKSEVTS